MAPEFASFCLIIGNCLNYIKKVEVYVSRLSTYLYVTSLCRIAPILNVDHVVAIINDFTHTRDWFYSFRWIPPRFFKNRLKSGNYTSEMEQIFLAQRALNPSSQTDLINLTPKEYRSRYVEFLRQSDKSPNFKPDPEKYRFKGKEAREERMYGILGLNETY